MRIQDQRREMLASEPIPKLLFKLALPAGIASAVMALYNVVGTIFIGQAVGPLGIAGLTIVMPLQIVAMGVGMMLGMGGASLASRTLGVGDTAKSERVLGNVIFYALVIGLIVTALGLLFSTSLLQLIGASDAIMPYAKGYFDIILLGMVLRIAGMSVNQLIRAEGNARVAMLSMISAFGLNIVLDAIFVLGLGMGVQGAAIGTVISEAVTFVYVAHYYLFQNSSLKIHWKNLRPDKVITRQILSIGFGSFVMTIGGSVVGMIMIRTLVAYGGDMAVASFGMLQRTMMFIFIPIMALGQGLQPILGFSYGARRPDRALAAIKLSIIAASVLALGSFLIIFFLPDVLMRVFTQDAALLSAASHAAKRMFFVAYLLGFQMVATTVFQALGKVVPAFLTSTSRQILFLLPLILILPRYLQIDGIWLAFPISDVLAFLLTLTLFLRELKELKNPDFSAEAGGKAGFPAMRG